MDKITPKHYNMKITPVEFILANDIPFCEGNVIKYVCRWKNKNGLEDLLKARTYLDFLIEDERKRLLEKERKHNEEGNLSGR